MGDLNVAKEKVSRHAVRLRELGLQPVDEIDHPDIMTPQERAQFNFEQSSFISTLPRAQRRAMQNMLAKPRFMYYNGWTFAHDEVGGEWAVQKKVNLAHLGFSNEVSEFFTDMREKQKKSQH